jgi:DNA-binding CsgD family transcriptional regulator
MYWTRVMWEILNKDKESCIGFFTATKVDEELLTVCPKKGKAKPTVKKPKQKKADNKYILIKKDIQIALSNREEQCISCLILGRTLNQMSECLALSVRTVEFYIKNIKSKFNCYSRNELIKLILSSQFWEDHIALF